MNLKKASLTDLDQLKSICVAAYSKNFFSHWHKGGLEWYLDKEFRTEKLKLDLLDKNTEYFFIQEDFKTVGFLKTKYNTSTTFSAENSLKLDKIYVLPAFKGKGIGKLALLKIIEKSRKLDVKNIFLGVIDTNWDAINFYEQLGFKFHSKTTLDMPYFKQKLKGMNRMVKELH